MKVTIADIRDNAESFKWFLKHQYTNNLYLDLINCCEEVLKLKFKNADENLYFITFGKRNADGQIMVRIAGYSLHEADHLSEALFWALVELINHIKEEA